MAKSQRPVVMNKFSSSDARWMYLVYMDAYMASIGSCFMVMWIIFKKHLLEVGLTQNQKAMTLRNVPNVDLLYLSCVQTPHKLEFFETTFG